MTIDYKALAERANECLQQWEALEAWDISIEPWSFLEVLRTVVTLLNGMANAEPIYFVMSGDSWVEVSKEVQARHGTKWQRTLYTHPAPQPQRQYYYRRIGCTADYPDDPHCICWHDEGTGPLPDGTATKWRVKTAPQPQAAQTLAPTMPTHDPAMGVSLYQDEEQPERQPVSEPTRSERLREAGFTGRDDRIECDECGKKFTPQMLPIHKCERDEAQAERDALAKALDTIHSWLVCAAIASAEDMAQSFAEMEQIAAAALAQIEKERSDG